ncbi:SDR family NAD(P)-dependent oxidoreductase [Candidatus Mycobacterium wuenschmannii]|uniref:SDR family NAD(P)-dependent oxidoreductase n=1 Tax=Candidatus Mycobacterium wuenschmannii TaxID=3027808 RepID=A0ABY8W5X3_9MYCO|nr:SDR family NAD(P)-dependent oxidoreductase [Candidatus Mycobacterium wuenschmannii]WIM89857.1 SDR family NAD(P)-dependent oxidoreductase [Candidatus Mycobacterium wuenschmannii]
MTRTPIALVTGATSGIGEATAHRLHDRGYVVYAAGRTPQALDALRSKGLQARSLDVTDESAVAELVEEIRAAHGGVDVVVNSAGYPLPCPLEQVERDDLRRLFETNVVATLHLSQLVLPGMRERGTGRIIIIGSTGGRFTSPGAGAYHTVKYGVEALSLSLGAEVAPFGVRVVLIDPTGTRTKFVQSQLDSAPASYAADDPYAEFKRRYTATTHGLAQARGLMVDADTVARLAVRTAEMRNPKPRYVVGLSGKGSVLARALLTDRMWNRVMNAGMKK